MAKESKSKILQKAVMMAARDGLHGITIGSLAKAVGMSKSGLIFHFGHKEQLQQDIFIFARDSFTESVIRPALQVRRGEPRLVAMIKNWADLIDVPDRNPSAGLILSASMDMEAHHGELKLLVRASQIQLFQTLCRAIDIACEENQFRSDLDVPWLAWRIFGCVLNYYHFKRAIEDLNAEVFLWKTIGELLKSSREQVSSSESADDNREAG